MVSPDQRIDPNREVTSRSAQEAQKRKPPTRKFDEVAEKVDDRRGDDDALEGSTNKPKKRPLTKLTSSKNGDEEDTSSMSIFDLARKGSKQKLSSDDEEKGGRSEDDDMEMVDTMVTKKKSQAEDMKKSRGLFGAVEQPDLAASAPPTNFVSPLATISHAVQAPQRPVGITPELQEIIDQIEKGVYIEKGNTGETQTIIPLKGPIFANANLIVTESAHAKGEMNITLDNLTAQAQQLINLHKGEIINDLANKNIVVHIFMTSPVQETKIGFTSSEERGQRQDQPGQGQGSNKQNKKRDEQET